jgi:UDP-N-acetylglucosamine acyltransferase
VYRYVFLKGFNTSEALSNIEQDIAATPERDEIVEFIRNAERGIIKGPL